MNNVSSLKINKNESPKTPGGISKSLLTPCRRVGLSRNWKRKGLSPFISPLSGTEETKQEKSDTRKRKQRLIEEESEQSPKTLEVSQEVNKDAAEVSNNIDIDRTPSRNVELPRRKKSKTLLSAISKCQENTQSPMQKKEYSEDQLIRKPESLTKYVEVEPVCTPICDKPNIRTKKRPSLKSAIMEQNSKSEVDIACKANSYDNIETKHIPVPEKSPKDLTKECIVVIQKKIFKQNSRDLENLHMKSETCNTNENKQKEENSGSQVLFDSDSDDVPLGKLNKNENLTVADQVINLDEDDDFTDTIKPKLKKLEEQNMQPKQKELKPAVKTKEVKHKIDKSKKTKLYVETSKPSQTSFDDEEDFEFDNKKTILIRKSYDKVTQPLKAKSTGSISQKDIDDLKARIEAKKKLLIAKSMMEDTKELRELVKKWQTGCQTALMELMELMKRNFPDKQNMDYSEILETLKIPASLVGYDSDNDCFNTPDDTTIILSGFNL